MSKKSRKHLDPATKQQKETLLIKKEMGNSICLWGFGIAWLIFGVVALCNGWYSQPRNFVPIYSGVFIILLGAVLVARGSYLHAISNRKLKAGTAAPEVKAIVSGNSGNSSGNGNNKSKKNKNDSVGAKSSRKQAKKKSN